MCCRRSSSVLLLFSLHSRTQGHSRLLRQTQALRRRAAEFRRARHRPAQSPFPSSFPVDCELGDGGAIILAELLAHHLFPNVTTLLLNSPCVHRSSRLDNHITEIGIRALSLVLTSSCAAQGLLSLSVAENALETEGARALSVIIRNNNKLQRLWANGGRECMDSE